MAIKVGSIVYLRSHPDSLATVTKLSKKGRASLVYVDQKGVWNSHWEMVPVECLNEFTR